MTEWYLSPSDFLKCEQETLIFLKDKLIVSKCLPTLYYYVQSNYFLLLNALRKYSNFDFESEIEINLHSKITKFKPGIANISAYIEKEGEKLKTICYNLDIIDKNQNRILRKFHFDYDFPGNKHRSPHPVIHLQYAGRLSDKIRTMNLECKHLDIDYDKPRLCNFPLSLALLINLVLKEFPGEDNTKLIESSEWRDLIRQNEKKVLMPFFNNCHHFFSNKYKDHLFVNDFYYGKCTN